MGSDLRVAFISQWFAPEPTVVPDGIAKALKNAGARVEVLTGIPNYPSGVVASGYDARRTHREAAHGLTVTRTPLYPSHDDSSLRRILNYVSWAVSASIFGLPTLKRSSVAVVYGSPITAALPAMIAKTLLNKPFVLVVQDIWPDSVFATGFLNRGAVFRIARACLTAFTQLVYRRAAGIVVISEGMKSLLMTRGVPEGKLEVVFNWVEHPGEPSGDPRDWRSEWGIEPSDFVLMYAGNHGPAQDLAAVIEAIALIPGGDVHLVLVGDGVEKQRLIDLAARVAPGRIHFVDPVPRDKISELMSNADVQLVALANDPLFAVTVPSKLQAIMASGLPVLAIAEGDVTRIVDEADCGASATPGVASEIARAIRYLQSIGPEEVRDKGLRGRDYYRAHMAEEVGAARYLRVVRDVLKEGDR